MRAFAVFAPPATLAVCAALACATGCAPSRPQLEPARVHAVTAEDIALTKVPRGTVIRRVLEVDRGKLVWAIDVAPAADSADARSMTVVRVDAVTGAVDGVSKDTLRKPPQAAETLAVDEP